jgi:hypothetical protein
MAPIERPVAAKISVRRLADVETHAEYLILIISAPSYILNSSTCQAMLELKTAVTGMTVRRSA